MSIEVSWKVVFKGGCGYLYIDELYSRNLDGDKRFIFIVIVFRRFSCFRCRDFVEIYLVK